MSNYYGKYSTGEAEFYSLSVLPAEERWGVYTAAKCAGKFVKMASLIPEGGFTGWKLCSRRKKIVCSAFSSIASGVTKDDYEWIFKGCADIGRESGDTPAPKAHTPEYVYLLRLHDAGSIPAYDPDTFTEPGDAPESEKADFSVLIDILEDTDAEISFIFGTEEGKPGGVIEIRLKDEMSLKLKTALLIAFRSMEIVRVNGACEPERMSPEYFRYALSGILTVLMGKKQAEEHRYQEEFIEEDLYEENPFIEHEPDKADNGPIDELELSVRSYNCLKRAGITTIGALRRMSDQELLRIRNLTVKCVADIRKALDAYTAKDRDRKVKPDPMEALNELIGLDEIKEQVRKIAAFARMKQDMKSRAAAADCDIALNMQFVGNPGTAKTTVARILAGVLHEVGLLESDELVETGRADLVARYEGQTADKVKEVFFRARGKVLFIDEAYSLLESWDGSFGDEAINTIVQEMENHRDETVVIFAGYPDRMEEFLKRNPGLKSRVPFTFRFRDYTVDEMVKITELEAKRKGFTVSGNAMTKVAAMLEAYTGHPELGNGRFCRNIAENAILNYATRVYGTGLQSEKSDFNLSEIDFTEPKTAGAAEKRAIGF